jgi:thiamine phosphate synthase YjbQ (UPF0047 family)
VHAVKVLRQTLTLSSEEHFQIIDITKEIRGVVAGRMSEKASCWLTLSTRRALSSWVSRKAHWPTV